MKIVFAIFHLLGGLNGEVKTIPIRDANKNESMMTFETYPDAEGHIRNVLLPEYKNAHYQIQKIYVSHE
jgi:hypothetical protein